MPELPEVETIRRQLKRMIVGKTVAGIEVFNPGSFVGAKEELIGRKVVGVSRYGKLLILNLISGKDLHLYVHLKMSGQLQYREEGTRSAGSGQAGKKEKGKQDEHLRVKIRFSDKSELLFIDQRKFGWMRVRDQGSEVRRQRSELPRGIDALDPKLTVKKLGEILSTSNRPIKTVLMDQSKIAGIGNIYASEILWQAKINPATKGLTFCAKSGVLINTIRKILSEAIKYGGSTMNDQLYRHVSGQAGNYWSRRRVYDREGEPCLRCQTPIEKGVIGQRSTYWCPGCQVVR